jgi:hypothetical protein
VGDPSIVVVDHGHAIEHVAVAVAVNDHDHVNVNAG